MKISVSQKTCPRYASPESARAPMEPRVSLGARRTSGGSGEAQGALQAGRAVDDDSGAAPRLGPGRLVPRDQPRSGSRATARRSLRGALLRLGGVARR